MTYSNPTTENMGNCSYLRHCRQKPRKSTYQEDVQLEKKIAALLSLSDLIEEPYRGALQKSCQAHVDRLGTTFSFPFNTLRCNAVADITP